MCEIGKALEILEVEPLSLPAPLPHWEKKPAEKPVTAEILESETTVEPSPAL